MGKKSIYFIIVLFGIGFAVLIGLFVVKPIRENAELNIKLQEAATEEALQVADSLSDVIPEQQKIIEQTKQQSEHRFTQEKRKQQSELLKAIKQYETSDNHIDTLPYNDLDSMFAKRLPACGGNRE